MAKQLNVEMNFSANTTQAKAAINDLYNSLQKLSTGNVTAKVDTASLQKAASSAQELQYHLQQAYNSQTGKIDLSKLNLSLNQAGISLKDLTSTFASMGAEGNEAFVNLAKSIAQADMPAITINSHLKELWVTLKNTARFQISSSIIHGFVGGLQKAYSYAQDLNESLNNIQIVTGNSTNQMAKFAEQANKAAKTLSTTTTAYTDAALIYYQQGD